MDPARLPIGELLLSQRRISAADLEKALSFQAQFGGRLGSILVRIGALSEDTLLPALASQLGFSLLGAEELPAHPGDIANALETSGIPSDWFIDQKAVVWEGADGAMHCAARDPLESHLHETLSAAFAPRPLEWHLVRSQDLERLVGLIDRRAAPGQHDELAHLREMAEEAPVIELVNNLLSQAMDENASDVHIEPEERAFEVRYRVDGVLQTRFTLPRERFDAVASRIKLVSGMDIAERRLPQDGRISMRAGGVDLDIRVSAVPGVQGESLVLRLLPKERAELRVDRLGMEADHLAQFNRWIREPHGIILVTGPTGSGKSTTLYATLDAANDRRRKIITVEDPVEFKLAGMTQIQAHSEIGYTFARALRAILRQDPDIIMVGEIRDLETAEIAVQAALTGHMVFSTLHTNDALSAFTRLLDMGLEPFLLASSVRAVQAQRLVRKLCARCARPAEPPLAVGAMADELRRRLPELLGAAPAWRAAAGCPECHRTGYRGRTGIYEFVEVTTELQNAVMARAPVSELAALARQHGYRSLREDGLIKAWRGVTSVEEVLRVTGVSEAGE